MTTKRKPGRPRKLDDSRLLSVRVDAATYDALRAAADAAGVAFSEYLRTKLS